MLWKAQGYPHTGGRGGGGSNVLSGALDSFPLVVLFVFVCISFFLFLSLFISGRGGRSVSASLCGGQISH